MERCDWSSDVCSSDLRQVLKYNRALDFLSGRGPTHLDLEGSGYEETLIRNTLSRLDSYRRLSQIADIRVGKVYKHPFYGPVGISTYTSYPPSSEKPVVTIILHENMDTFMISHFEGMENITWFSGLKARTIAALDNALNKAIEELSKPSISS